MSRLVTVYGRPGCHLCDEALALLARLHGEHPFALRIVDIEDDPVLHARYLERIPVVALDGEELYDFFVDEPDLRRRLQAVESKEGMSVGEIPGATLERSDDGAPAERLSLGVAARLSRYLQVLTQARKMGRETISSQELSEYTHVNSTQIRRDLSGFGRFGKRGVGYNVDSLLSQIRRILQTGGQHNIALFGAGHLGKAIASSDIFADHGFNVVAIFDADPRKIGSSVGGQIVRDVAELDQVVEDEGIVVGVLAVPTVAAQPLADRLVEAGVRIIFNYSDALLQVPPEVTVHTSTPAVDLLHALYFYLS